MEERFTLRKFYERESEISAINFYLQILEDKISSSKEKEDAKKWLNKKLREYARAQFNFGTTFEQKAFLDEFRDRILTALADVKNKLS